MEETMIPMLLKASGGVGLLLLGIIVMTDGLQMLVGDTLKSVLMRFTKSPLTGALTGTAITAILQSSTVTTVTAVGFVGAGLMTFPEALGIIFGANVGTTITGWMVALLGFKFHISTFAFPLVLIGSTLKLVFKGKVGAFGYAIGGFGLIFVGLTLLQEGMSGFGGIITPDNLPADTYIGRIELVALGILATLITHSSSAGVATVLAMLFSDAINFEQAAALVIGMDVGTTVTALMVSIGGSVNVRRTGFSHVFYNLLGAVLALLLITPYAYIWERLAPGTLLPNAEIALVAFHTLFNLLSVIIILPFTYQFARIVEKIIPSKEPQFTEKLDKKLLDDPPLALEVARISAQNEVVALFRHINFLLGDLEYGQKADLALLQSSLDQTQNYIDEIKIKQDKDGKWQKLVSLIHLLDHTQRLHERCDEEEYRAMEVKNSPDFDHPRQLLASANQSIIDALSSKSFDKAAKIAQKYEDETKRSMKLYRDTVTRKIADDQLGITPGTRELEAARWLIRVSHHMARICYYTQQAVLDSVR